MRLLRTVYITASSLIFLLSLIGVTNVVLHRDTITRKSLGIDSHFDEEKCHSTLPQFDFPGKMIAEKVAEDYFKYALIALNAYDYPNNQEFTFDRLQEIAARNGLPARYERVEKSQRDGLNYVYYKTIAKPTEVIVGIRGTVPTNALDWFSNFSWFTGVLPIKNHYDTARSILIDIRRKVNDDSANYVIVGHSLGGGLAQHLAAGFPCTSSVVLDTSFVTNTFLYKKPFTQYRSVHIFERDDELTKLKAILLGAERDSIGSRWYPLNLIDCGTPKSGKDGEFSPLERALRFKCKNFQHSIRDISVAMSRMIADCQIKEPDGCGMNVSRDTSLRNLYCDTYGIKDEICKLNTN